MALGTRPGTGTGWLGNSWSGGTWQRQAYAACHESYRSVVRRLCAFASKVHAPVSPCVIGPERRTARIAADLHYHARFAIISSCAHNGCSGMLEPTSRL